MTYPAAAATNGTLAENRLGVLLSVLVTVIMCVWIGAGESDAKYAIYALPPLMMLTCAMVMRWRIAIDPRSFRAFVIFASVALISTVGNSYGSFATRDLLILTGYLLLLVFAVRVPPFVADACLASLAIATVVVAMVNGIGANLDILSSNGILESPLAFPLGMVFLYFVGTRQWGRAAIAFILFFLAFKRIAIASALVVLIIEFAMMLVGRKQIGRLLAFLTVLAASIVALFLLQIFDYVAFLLNNEQLSGNSISLGRSEFATILWRELHTSGVTHLLTGFGPGAADELLNRTIGESNPHNDWLKILYDYGALGFVAFHAVLYLIHPNTPLGNRLYVYIAIVMSTDNVLIYLFYYIYLFLILRISPSPQRTAEPAPRYTEVWQ